VSFGPRSGHVSNDRLQRVTAPRAQGTPVAPGRAPSQAKDDSDDGITPMFIGTMAAAVLVVGAGLYFFLAKPSPGSTSEVIAASSVDGTCAEGWEKNQSNVDQMHCYMTTYVARLCEPAERRHLIATIGRFEKDYAAYNARFMAASMGSIAKVQVNALAIGVESARMERAMRDPNASEEERSRRMGNVMKMTGDVLSGPNKVMSEKVNKEPYYKLEDHFAKLAAAGYVTEKDFGAKKPKWVNNGFKAVKVVRDVCTR
jgi:hypothetical protein